MILVGYRHLLSLTANKKRNIYSITINIYVRQDVKPQVQIIFQTFC